MGSAISNSTPPVSVIDQKEAIHWVSFFPLEHALEPPPEFAEPCFDEATGLAQCLGDLIVVGADVGEDALTGIV
jgi:hypothetical protein